MDAENTVVKKEALLGNLEVFLDWIELENVKSTVQSCFCVLKCAEHWALTASQSIEATMYWKWLLKLPIYEPATVLSLTVFCEGGRVRQVSQFSSFLKKQDFSVESSWEIKGPAVDFASR